MTHESFRNVSLKGNNGRIKVKVVDDLVITQIALSSHKPKEGRTTLLLHLSGADDSEQTVCIGSLASPRVRILFNFMATTSVTNQALPDTVRTTIL